MVTMSYCIPCLGASNLKEKECNARLIVQSKMTMDYLAENIMKCNNIILEGETKFLTFKENYTITEIIYGVQDYELCIKVSQVLKEFIDKCEKTK